MGLALQAANGSAGWPAGDIVAINMPDGTTLGAFTARPARQGNNQAYYESLRDAKDDDGYKTSIRKAMECERDGTIINHDEIICNGLIMKSMDWMPHYGLTFCPGVVGKPP